MAILSKYIYFVLVTYEWILLFFWTDVDLVMTDDLLE